MTGISIVAVIEESNMHHSFEKLRRRSLRDSSDPLSYPNSVFISYFRLNKEGFLMVMEKISQHLPSSTIPTIIQLATTLRFLGTGSYQGIIGMYLGELVRLILIDALEKNLVFVLSQNKNNFITKLSDGSRCFETSMISDIEADTFPECKKTRDIINNLFGISKASVEDCQKLRYICECVSQRAANLVAVGISGLINKINEPHVVVGLDGSVYRYHPKFDACMRATIKKLINSNIHFDLMLSEDGSGRGAALVAAVVASRSS